MLKVYARKSKNGSGWEVVGGGNTVYTMGGHRAEDIVAKRNKR